MHRVRSSAPRRRGGRGSVHTVRVAVAVWFAAAVVAVAQSVAALTRARHDRLADLDVYVEATTGLRQGASLYDYAAAGTGAPFTYPPLSGLLFLPLTLIDIDVLRVIWTAATVALVALLAVIVARAYGTHRLLPRQVAPAAIALLLFASAPVSSNLRFGQVSVILTLLVLVDCLGYAPRRLAGVATGLAAAVKLTPLIFIPYLWLAGERRAAVTATGTFLGGTGLAWLILPGESIRFWLTEMWDVDRVGNIVTAGNQSINGTLLRLGAPDDARTLVLFTAGLAVVAIALVRGAVAYRDGDRLAGVVIVGAAGLAFSPVSWTHHQTWLVLAALLVVSEHRGKALAWTVLVAATIVLPVTTVGAGLPTAHLTDNVRALLAVVVACLIPTVRDRAGSGPGRAAVSRARWRWRTVPAVRAHR
ncbi:glycosyltransferase 87 family protein [Solwaraspora sp. WMMD406]|uniref:glycosyltransferase 87 family protein n=1 Tax=Solwaraspora sp. WMMD406 TaxID=3016095 RepID=UPI00241663DB|nr:glycosyltransferase 87 family protein [Solwaraspora sp. WMMD406]MDG4765087.1 glycosyltransferase 87 family protein [Solwaraspora sp. WMMD406]